MGTERDHSSSLFDKLSNKTKSLVGSSDIGSAHLDDRSISRKAANVVAHPWQTLRSFRNNRNFRSVKWPSSPSGSAYRKLSPTGKLMTGRRGVGIGFHPDKYGPLLFTTSASDANGTSTTATRYLDRATEETLNEWLANPASEFAKAVRNDCVTRSNGSATNATRASACVRRLCNRQTIGGPDIVYLKPADVLFLNSLLSENGGAVETSAGSVIIRDYLDSIQQDNQHTVWPSLSGDSSPKSSSVSAQAWPSAL